MNINKAIKIAENAACMSTMKHKLGAILYDNKHYTIGYNRQLNCSIVMNNNKIFSIHAEGMAILKGIRVGIDFNSSTLCVVRINREGMLRCSLPCEMCTRLIEKMGIRQVWYVKGSLQHETYGH